MEFLLKLLLLGIALVGGQSHAPTPKWAGLWRTAQGARHSERLVFPEGAAPKKLIVKTLQVGSGEELQSGDSFVADYRAFTCHSGKLWEDFWQEGFSTRFGAGENVKGWEIGLAGMRVGGWLELIVPSPLVHDTVALVYVVRLREIT